MFGFLSLTGDKDTNKRAKNQKKERKTKESEQSHVNLFTGANSRFLAKGIIAMHRNVFLFFLVFHSERKYFRGIIDDSKIVWRQ